jgi:hypothetical protein
MEGAARDRRKRRPAHLRRWTSPRFDLVIDALGVGSMAVAPLPPLPFGTLVQCRLPEGQMLPRLMPMHSSNATAAADGGVLPVGLRPGAPRRPRSSGAFAADLAAWRRPARSVAVTPQLCRRRLHQPGEGSRATIFAAYCHGTRARPPAPAWPRAGDSWHSASTARVPAWPLLDARPSRAEANRDISLALDAYSRSAAAISGSTSSPPGCSRRPTSRTATQLR